MAKFAAMPIYGKNLNKSSTPEPIDQWPWNLVCSFVYVSTTMNIQIITLGWPWPILRQGQIWSYTHLYGKKWKLFIFMPRLFEEQRKGIECYPCPSRTSVRPSVRTSHLCVRAVTPKPYGIYSWNFTGAYITIRRCVMNKEDNSCIFGFWIISPWLNSI